MLQMFSILVDHPYGVYNSFAILFISPFPCFFFSRFLPVISVCSGSFLLPNRPCRQPRKRFQRTNRYLLHAGCSLCIWQIVSCVWMSWRRGWPPPLAPSLRSPRLSSWCGSSMALQKEQQPGRRVWATSMDRWEKNNISALSSQIT